jgi:hypothetical protein
MYRTLGKNIQIFFKPFFPNPKPQTSICKIFQILRYTKTMEISEFNKMQGTESENLVIKTLGNICSNGCTCKSTLEHKLESSCVCGSEVCNC